MKNIRNSYHLYAMITIIFWSLAYVLTKLALGYFSAFPLGFLRYLVASITLIIVALVTKMKLPKKKDIPWFLLAGALGFFIYMIVFNQGQKLVSASTASVIIATVPVITALIARIVYQEKMQKHKWFAIGVEFVGVLVLTLMNGVLSVNQGVIWLFLAAISVSVYNILQRKLTKNYSALQTSAYSIIFGTILLAVFLPDSVAEASAAPAIQWVYLGILGVCSSAIAYVAWSKAFTKAKQISQVSNYMFITPFLTSVLGFVIAREVPETSTIIGGGIILTGVFIFNFGGKKERT